MRNGAQAVTITPRVTIRGRSNGFSVTSRGGGVCGTQIFVKHLSTALLIKEAMKTLDGAARSARIDLLISEEAQCRACGIERDDKRAQLACLKSASAFHDFGGK